MFASSDKPSSLLTMNQGGRNTSQKHNTHTCTKTSHKQKSTFLVVTPTDLNWSHCQDALRRRRRPAYPQSWRTVAARRIPKRMWYRIWSIIQAASSVSAYILFEKEIATNTSSPYYIQRYVPWILLVAAHQSTHQDSVPTLKRTSQPASPKPAIPSYIGYVVV